MARVNWGQAMGEATFIVLGILLALSGDAWREQRSERAAETEYLAALEVELESLKAYTQRVIDEAESVENSGRHLLTISYGWPAAGVDLDSLAILIGDLGNEIDWAPRLTVYQDLINTGTVRTIRSDKIRRGLAEVVGAVEWVADRGARHNQYFWDRLEPYLRQQLPLLRVWTYSSLPAPKDSWAQDEFLTSMEFQNLVAAKSFTALDVRNGAIDLVVVVDRLLVEIALERAAL